MDSRWGVVFLSTASYGQSVSGNIEGWLVNEKNEAVVSATIVVMSADLLGTRGTSSNEQGYFRIQSLPTGNYRLKVSAISYSPEELNDVRIGLGTTTNVGAIKLKEEAVEVGEVVVTSERPRIDQSTTSVGESFANRDQPEARNMNLYARLTGRILKNQKTVQRRKITTVESILFNTIIVERRQLCLHGSSMQRSNREKGASSRVFIQRRSFRHSNKLRVVSTQV
jgi:hypothetical protein